ncbi:hypothetical protein D3C72_1637080 [compost metagenome]
MACVTRAVLTTPAAKPLALASSSKVVAGVPLPVPHLLASLLPFASVPGSMATVLADIEMTSLFILTPVM